MVDLAAPSVTEAAAEAALCGPGPVIIESVRCSGSAAAARLAAVIRNGTGSCWHQHLNVTLAAGEVTPLAGLGGLLLWLLRLSLAPASTLAGFRAWVLECPIAPGRRAGHPAPVVAAAASPRAISRSQRGRGPRADTKSAMFLALVTEHYGPLAVIPLDKAAKIAVLTPENRTEIRKNWWS